jgi:superfamily II DNA or RNA helicase
LEYDAAAKAQVIFATSQYASEGLDIPALDTLVLASPMSDVEQAVGRIQRPFDGKKDPIVVDVRDDSIPMFEAQARKRDRFYERVV